MASIILIANPKGGTGKTTIADELAFCFERNNLTVSFANLDNQGGTIHETVEHPNSDVMIVDTPGQLTDQAKDWAKDADLLLVPTNPSVRDVIPTIDFVESMKRYVPVHLVINRYQANRVVCKQFDEFVSANGMSVLGRLPDSTAFPKAALNRDGVITDRPYGPPAMAVKELARNVLAELGISKRIR